MKNSPQWMNPTPWSVSRPIDRPLTKQEIEGHNAILPFHGPNDRLTVMQVEGRNCCVLAYLVPQTEHTSRLIFAWALMAPLILVREVDIRLPLTALVGVIDDYDPTCEAVMLASDLNDDAIVESRILSDKKIRPIMLANGPGVIIRIQPSEVAVAPIDTPVHAFNADLHDFPRI